MVAVSGDIIAMYPNIRPHDRLPVCKKYFKTFAEELPEHYPVKLIPRYGDKMIYYSRTIDDRFILIETEGNKEVAEDLKGDTPFCNTDFEFTPQSNKSFYLDLVIKIRTVTEVYRHNHLLLQPL